MNTTARTFSVFWDPARRRLIFKDETGEQRRVPTAGGGGSGGVTDHGALTSLGWTVAGHTGTADRLAGFNGSGAASVYTLSQVLDLVGSAADGDLLVRTGGVWARLPAGTTATRPLTSNGAGVAPSYQPFRVENRTSDPASPAEGELWLRIDL